MKKRGRGSALLVELMIVVLFYTLVASVLIEMFTTGYTMVRRVSAGNEALLEGQNLAEMLYAAPDPETVLKNEGFEQEDECWTLNAGNLLLRVSGIEENTETGILRTYTVEASNEDNVLLTLPVSRFIAGEVQP